MSFGGTENETERQMGFFSLLCDYSESAYQVGGLTRPASIANIQTYDARKAS